MEETNEGLTNEVNYHYNLQGDRWSAAMKLVWRVLLYLLARDAKK